jgi:hypothetical protein
VKVVSVLELVLDTTFTVSQKQAPKQTQLSLYHKNKPKTDTTFSVSQKQTLNRHNFHYHKNKPKTDTTFTVSQKQTLESCVCFRACFCDTVKVVSVLELAFVIQ